MKAESQLHWCGYRVREGTVEAPSQLSSSTALAAASNSAASAPVNSMVWVVGIDASSGPQAGGLAGNVKQHIAEGSSLPKCHQPDNLAARKPHSARGRPGAGSPTVSWPSTGRQREQA